MTKDLPSQEVLKSLLDYNPETGRLFWKARGVEGFASERSWKAWNTRFAGKKAFIKQLPKGHLCGSIWGESYYAHRVICKWMTGEEPDVVDHEDGNHGNNSWKNLRDVSQQINSQSACRSSKNKSGVTGVAWDARANRWRARIKVGYRDRFLGYFSDFDQAVSSRKSAEIEHGFHKNHGRVV